MTLPQRKRDGALGKVVWEDVPVVTHGRIAKKFLYQDLLDIVRNHPGQSARIAAFTEGTVKQKLNRQRNATSMIRKHLDTTYPLELWSIRPGIIPGSWHDRGIWATFIRPCTQEEHDADLNRRRAVAQRIRGVSPSM